MSGQTKVSPNSKQSKGMSIAGMILGIVGLLFSFTCLWWIGIILAIVGVCLSAVGMKSTDEDSRGMAIAGLATSISAVLISIIWIIIYSLIFAPAYAAYDSVYDSMYDYNDAMDDWEREYDKAIKEYEDAMDDIYYSY